MFDKKQLFFQNEEFLSSFLNFKKWYWNEILNTLELSVAFHIHCDIIRRLGSLECVLLFRFGFWVCRMT